MHLLALLPLRLLYGLSDILAFLARRVMRYRLKVVRKNLRNSFPEKSPRELRKIEKAFYRDLTDSIVETIKLLHISDEELKRRVEVSNPDEMERIAAENPFIILYLGHYGNWEWVPATTLSLKSPKIMGSLYKPLRDKLIAPLMMKMRDRLGIRLIPSRQAYRRLLEMKAEGEPFMIGFIADQRPVGGPFNHWTTFLNQPTAFLGGAETIGNRIGAKYLYLEMEKTKRGHYRLTYKEMEPSQTPAEDFPYTRRYFEMLEQTIRREPAYWLWTHNRWKATPSDAVIAHHAPAEKPSGKTSPKAEAEISD